MKDNNPNDKNYVPLSGSGLVLVIMSVVSPNLKAFNFKLIPCSHRIKSFLLIVALDEPKAVRASYKISGMIPVPLSFISKY